MKNKLVGKLLVLAASAVMVFSFAACDSKNDASADNTNQTENAVQAEPNLDALEGTFVNLFDAFSEEKYNDLWAE